MKGIQATAAIVALGAAAILMTTPASSAASETQFTKCGERANPSDGKKEHRWQEEGVCITGGDYHTAYWLDGCTENGNHQSSSC
jgi:hypothetical protein